jgi:two-component system, OmpR family, response regulator
MPSYNIFDMNNIDILIIDDEIKFADMLSRRLTLRGVTCVACYDGNSGLKWIKENPGAAGMILLDLRLPDIYGTQVLAGIKKIDLSVPVFIITGHGTKKDEDECIGLGALEFIHKPIGIEKIITLLKQVRGSV